MGDSDDEAEPTSLLHYYQRRGRRRGGRLFVVARRTTWTRAPREKDSVPDVDVHRTQVSKTRPGDHDCEGDHAVVKEEWLSRNDPPCVKDGKECLPKAGLEAHLGNDSRPRSKLALEKKGLGQLFRFTQR